MRNEAQFYHTELDDIYRKQRESQERVQAVAGSDDERVRILSWASIAKGLLDMF